jgi:hypothetical protein
MMVLSLIPITSVFDLVAFGKLWSLSGHILWSLCLPLRKYSRDFMYSLTIKIKHLAMLRKIHGTNFFHIKFLGRRYHRIGIPAYAVEQQWWQSGVPKNEVSFIFKIMLVLYQSVSISGPISNIYWHASKCSSISFSHWQCPLDHEFSFPRFVGLLILSLWVVLTSNVKMDQCCPQLRFFILMVRLYVI